MSDTRELEQAIERVRHDKDLSPLIPTMEGLGGITQMVTITREMQDSCPCKPDCIRCELDRAVAAQVPSVTPEGGAERAASLLCETRGHIGRRPCDFCQMQIRACLARTPQAAIGADEIVEACAKLACGCRCHQGSQVTCVCGWECQYGKVLALKGRFTIADDERRRIAETALRMAANVLEKAVRVHQNGGESSTSKEVADRIRMINFFDVLSESRKEPQ